MKLLIATSNPGKMREYQILLADLPATLLSLADVGLESMNVDENGTTLEANAKIKVMAYAQASGLTTLADDTGLFVDALGGAPGVYPARYGGPGLTMAQRRGKLLATLGDTPDAKRTARFVCVIALAQSDSNTVQTMNGSCEGRIARAEVKGSSGFGYDAIFIPNGYDISWGQLSMTDKNRISHRGQAARRIIPLLNRMIQS